MQCKGASLLSQLKYQDDRDSGWGWRWEPGQVWRVCLVYLPPASLKGEHACTESKRRCMKDRASSPSGSTGFHSQDSPHWPWPWENKNSIGRITQVLVFPEGPWLILLVVSSFCMEMPWPTTFKWFLVIRITTTTITKCKNIWENEKMEKRMGNMLKISEPGFLSFPLLL